MNNCNLHSGFKYRLRFWIYADALRLHIRNVAPWATRTRYGLARADPTRPRQRTVARNDSQQTLSMSGKSGTNREDIPDPRRAWDARGGERTGGEAAHSLGDTAQRSGTIL